MALIAEVVAAAAILLAARPVHVLPAVPPAASPPVASSAASTLHLPDARTVYLVGTAPVLTRIAAEVPGALDAVVGFWGDDWNREIVIIATDSDAQFAAEARTGTQEIDLAAATVADRFDPARRFVAGERIVFAPGANTMRPGSLRIVLRHELFHYAARADTAADAPRWLTEGVADYVGRPQTPVRGQAALGTRLPSDADFDAAGPRLSAAYDRAWLFARFVADSYGPPTLRRLYLLACGPGHPDPAAAVTVTLGTPLPDVLSGWQRWLAG
ncbi:hypothetical protein [Mycobacterium sp.]|uniref:hypothetical protein n=1 Tax=Mycobacterium sp. TaxID=1785 RepID=UPI0039C90CB9